MADTFVVRNQLGHYWGKKKRWVDGSNLHSVLHTPHQDEAINTLFELSSKDTELRGEVLSTELNDRGDPEVEASDIPLPEDPEENTLQNLAPITEPRPGETVAEPEAEEAVAEETVAEDIGEATPKSA